MKLAPFLALALQATPAIQPPPMPAVQPSPVPIDWSVLPPLPYRQPPAVTAAMNSFVAGEIAGQRCPMPKPADGHYLVKVDLVVLVGGDTSTLKAIPHAIQCPTVEQYSAGLVSSFARNNLLPRPSGTAQWYRTTITYDWQG